MKLKVHNGTRSGESLCHTCGYAYVRKGAGFSQEIIKCEALYRDNDATITWPVVECSSYYNKTLPSLKDMTAIAYFVNSDKKSGKIGFTSPDQDRNDKVERETPDSPFNN